MYIVKMNVDLQLALHINGDFLFMSSYTRQKTFKKERFIIKLLIDIITRIRNKKEL